MDKVLTNESDIMKSVTYNLSMRKKRMHDALKGTGKIHDDNLDQWSQLSKLALFYFFGNKRVSFLLVVKYNYLFIILFPLLLLYNVVKKEGASMFVRVIKNNKGKKNTCFCALVESYRDSSGVPKHRVLINFGQVDEESVPFLKAAFAKKKPRLVYDDE